MEGSESSALTETEAPLFAELTPLIKLIKDISAKDASSLYTQRTQISPALRNALPVQSSLQPFPLLSLSTYNGLITALLRHLKADATNAAAITHLWSYLTGIPVVGLAHGKGYYKANLHLFTDNEKNSSPAPNMVHLPDETMVSALIFRKDTLPRRRIPEIAELQKIGWSLLTQELIPLEQFAPKTVIKFLYTTLLTQSKQNTPLYSWGLIHLFKNTAVYLSLADEDDSGLIASPCSIENKEYLGFQDGVFIDQKTIHRAKAPQVFGQQFFVRALFNVYPCFDQYPRECSTCLSTLKGVYYPHYTFGLLSAESKKEIEELKKPQESLTDSMKKFSKAFDEYIDNKGTGPRLIKELLKDLDRQQLTVTVTPVSSLQKFMFNPTFNIELPSMTGKSSDQKLSSVELITNLIDHLCCAEHQEVTEINLAHNGLGDQEIALLARALAHNIVPDLTELDLSYNNITGKGIKRLCSLLKRDAFSCLLLKQNDFRKIPRKIPPELAQKNSAQISIV